MKKIVLALAVLASIQVSNAEVKPINVATSNLEAAKAASLNEKKAEKFTTWLKLGECYIDAYDSPAGTAWLGASKQELTLVGFEKPTAVEEVVLSGAPYTKEIHNLANYYFDANGSLKLIEITKPICENALDYAVEAYQKAYALDTKKAKKDDIVKSMEDIHMKYLQAAYDQYTLGNGAKACEIFKKAYDVTTLEPSATIDTLSLYYAAQTSIWAGNLATAKEYLTTCVEKYGFETETGDVHAKLAEIYLKEGDNAKAKSLLEQGFEAFPQGQSILIGLINYYLTNNEDPSRLFTLLDKAKANEPNNASLYYVEGNINSELGEFEKAIEAYEKCAEINPNYEFGYIGEGQMYYKRAIDIQEKAQSEMDDAKYMELVKEFESCLKKCIVPFEKAYNMTQDDEIKSGISEYLKNAAFRFRTEPEYQAIYEKYSGNKTE